MENQRKCFSEEHKEIDAVIFCPECRIYMCNKCENYHLPFFKSHHPYNINKENEIFTGFCKEKNHPNKLEYFCIDHNQLCCAACLCKLNKIGDGQHKDCEVCLIKDIKEEKMNQLNDNIKCLEDLENQFNEDFNQLKEIFQKIEKDKEDLKLKVQKIFTKIRSEINNREDELLLKIDDIYHTKYFDEDIIKSGEKIPKQIKISLEKGKLLNNEWNDYNIYSNINDCINIENNIEIINKISKNINKCKKSNEIKIKFSPSDMLFNNFIDSIKSFGNIYYNKYSFKECPKDIKNERKFEITGENRNILTKVGNDGYMGTICEYELDQSIEEHKWKIKFLKTKSKYINIGVATIDFDIHSSIYNTCGWYLYCKSSPPSLYSGPPFNYDCVKTNLSNIKDEVVVVTNMKKRTIKFIINGEDKGDSYSNIPLDKPLFPVVLLHDRNDSIEITEYK